MVPNPSVTWHDGPVLIVDGANVVGSRPDGWWRDRAGAARRLYDRLVSAVEVGSLAGPVVLVLEGAARRGLAPGEHDEPVEVVHAPADGDDTIVGLIEQRTATEQLTVVTADRELRRRVISLGADVIGPGHLLDILDRGEECR